MKRFVLVAALLFVAFWEIKQRTVSQTSKLSNKPIEISKEATTTAQVAQGEVATVAIVIDGDTIELTDGRRVRYIGIDAPETVHEGTSAECFSEQAKEENKKLTDGKTIRLEKDISDVDSYGRLLRYVFIEKISVNEELVRGGFARAWYVPPDESRREAFLAAQQQARAADRGLWHVCR